MSCAINPISMAHQWRKPFCAVIDWCPKEKAMAHLLAPLAFSNGAPMAQWRTKQSRAASQHRLSVASKNDHRRRSQKSDLFSAGRLAALTAMTCRHRRAFVITRESA
jgi:hypothetical protein